MERYDQNHLKINERNERNRHYYKGHTKDPKPLKIYTPVIVLNQITGKWDKTGIIVGVGKRRDYATVFAMLLLCYGRLRKPVPVSKFARPHMLQFS